MSVNKITKKYTGKTVKKAKIMPAKKVAIPAKVTLKWLKNQLATLGYSVGQTENGGDRVYQLISLNGSEIFDNYVHLRVSTMIHCCGVREIGNLSIQSIFHYTKNELYILDLLMAYAFLSCKEDETEIVATSRTTAIASNIIFCSNSIGACTVFERAAKKYLKNHYEAVTQARNPNGRNLIKIFVTFP